MADWESRITPSLRDDEAELEASIESCVALCHCMASEEDEDHLSYDDARCRAAEARAAARGCGGRGGHGGAAPMEALAPAAPLVPRPPPSRVLKPQPLPWVPRSLLADLKTHEAAALVGLHASTRLPQPRPQGRDLVCFLPKNWRARAKPQKRLTSIGFQEQSRPLPPKPRAPKAETPMPGFAVSFGDDAFKCGRRVRGPPALPAALPTAPTEPSMLMPRGLDALQAKDRFDASQALALQDSRLFRSTSESDFVQTSQHCKRWAALASMLDRHELVAADAIQALRGAKGTRGADVQGAFQGSDAQGAGSPSSALRSAKTFAAASATRGGASPRAPASSGPATPVDAVFDAAAIVSTLAQLCGAVGRNVADRVAAMSQWRGEMLRSALQEFESFATDAVGGAATVLRGRILQLDGSGAVLAVVVAGVQEKHLTMQNVLARRLDDVAHMRKQVTVNDVAAARLAEIYRRKAAAKLIQAKFLEGLCCKNQPEADEGTNAQRKNQPKADEATEQGGAPRQASVRRGLGRGASAGGASVGGASAGAPAGGLLAGGCGAVGLGGLLADADGGHRASTPQAPLHVSFKLGNASLSKLVDASSFEIGDASSAPVSAASAHGIFLKQTCDAPLTQGEKYLVKKLNRAVVPLQAAWRRTAGLKYVQAMRYALRNADLRRATARLTRATRSDVESMHASVDGLEATFVRGVSTPRKAFEPGKTPVAATSRSVRLRREAVEARHAARRVRDVSAIGELAERLRSMALLAYRHARRNFALQELRSVVAQWRKRRPRPKAALDLYGMFVDYVQGLENGQAVHLDIGDAIGDDAASWRSSRDAASRRSSDASAGSFSDGEDLVGGDAGKRGHKGPLAQPLSLLAVARRQKRKIHEPTGEAAPGAWDAALRPAALQGNLVAQKFAAMPMAGAVIPYAGAGVPLASAESRALPFRAAAAAFSPSAFSKVKKGARRASVAPTSTQRAAAATSPRRASQPAAAAQPAVSAAREAFAAQVRKQSAQQAAQQAAAQQVVAQDGAAERASPVLDDLAAAESRAASGRVVVMVPQSSSPFRASPLQSEASPEMLRFVPEPLQFASLDSGASPVADTAVKAAQRSACAALFAMDLPGFVSEKRRRQSVVAAKRLSTLMAVKHQRSLRPLRPVFDMQAEFARQALYSDYEEPPHPSKKAPSVADSGDDAISKSESGVGAAPAQHRAISRVALRVVREHKDALGLLLTPQHRSTLVADISKVVAEATPRRGAAWLRLRYHELTLALRRRFGAPSVNFDQMPSLGWFPNCLLDAEIQLAVAAGFKGFAVDEKFEKCGCQCTDAHTSRGRVDRNSETDKAPATGTLPQGPCHGPFSQEPCHGDLVTGILPQGTCYRDLATGTLSWALFTGTLPQGPCHVTWILTQGPCNVDLVTGTLPRGPCHGSQRDLVTGTLLRGPCHGPSSQGDFVTGFLSRGPCHRNPVTDRPF
ncbi:hypothetical protein M885DRAFT_324542 [Pelagophyceae sp. CCMP2097]|nr:hypothetical protein M885DRAFT_324542 [Pelagophyceae sp. CCMP2097]